ncbi:choice-of-anchor J domain-containing protein [bacterium]|nr:choice-of-anchor J domain-containing protein [bacterium]MBU1984674.1 choice-of-anchor J domain-containing protein [bacterium]
MEPVRSERASSLDVLYYVEGPIPIPDNPGNNTNDTAVSVLTIPDTTTIADLNVRIVISHSWVRDLYISLTGPQDTSETVLLNLLPQDHADTLDGWFDDEAGISILDQTAPLVGIWRPVEELSVFDGRSVQGDWTLRVWDRFHLDSGYVALWGVEINRPVVLSGYVTNSETQDSLSGVKVEPLPTTSFTFTNSLGYYSFDLLDSGSYSVRFSKNFFDTLIVENVRIVPNRPTTLNASLHPNIIFAINEDFEDVAPGTLPEGWSQVDVDSGSTTHAAFPGPSIWQVYDAEGLDAHSGSRFVGNHFNDGALANDDWLILPEISVQGSVTLSYWAASQDSNYLENFEVRVSTSGTDPEDFTETVQQISNVPGVWTQYSHDLSAYADSAFYVAFHYTSLDKFMLKIDDVVLGYATSGVSRPASSVPQAFVFHGNYPNPFNTATEFRFDLSKPARVSLTLFDVLGRKAAVVTDEFYSAGSQRILFDAEGLSSGIYFARLSTDGASQIHKIVLLK